MPAKVSSSLVSMTLFLQTQVGLDFGSFDHHHIMIYDLGQRTPPPPPPPPPCHLYLEVYFLIVIVHALGSITPIVVMNNITILKLQECLGLNDLPSCPALYLFKVTVNGWGTITPYSAKEPLLILKYLHFVSIFWKI